MSVLLIIIGIGLASGCIHAATVDSRSDRQKVEYGSGASDIKRMRDQASWKVLLKKENNQLTWTQMADRLNCSPTWLASVVLGQSSMDVQRSERLGSLLRLGHEVSALTLPPLKGQVDWSTLSQDPLIYRLHEAVLVYGTSIKTMIHELFGDGIMSAIDFEVDVKRAGDRVHVNFNGKFLPYRRW